MREKARRRGERRSNTQTQVEYANIGRPYKESPHLRAFLLLFCTGGSGEVPLRALDLASLHAARADVGLADAALLVADGDLLDVRTEHAVGHSMRVADATTERRGFAANFANLRHNSQLHVRAGFQTADNKKAYLL